MSTADPARAGGMSGSYAGGATREYVEETSGDGWVLFAGTMLLMVGTLNVIDGIAAVSNSAFFVDNARFIIFDDLNTWGWIVMILGAVQFVAVFGIWARTPGVRWFGVAVALVNAIAQLLFISAYPFWSLALFTIDILVIYGLIAHGKRVLA
jgi:hypothetical protein